MGSLSPLKGAPLRNPGQSIEDEIQRLFDDKLLPYLLFPCITWLLAFTEFVGKLRDTPRTPGAYVVVATGFTILAAVRVWRLRTKIKRLRLGRDGERVVGQFLESLRVDGARIFHDVPGDGFNIDHVVISTRGLYVVETKTLSKPSPDARVSIRREQLLVAGRTMERDPITQAKAAADWLRRELEASTGKKLTVRGVVVFPGWFVEPMDATLKKNGPWVLEPKALPSFIEQETESLTETDVSLTAYHLSRYIRARAT